MSIEAVIGVGVVIAVVAFLVLRKRKAGDGKLPPRDGDDTPER